MESTLNRIDIFIALSCLIPFVMGITGRGVLRLSLSLATAVISLWAAYVFSGEVVSAGFTEDALTAAAVLFAGAFALLSAALWALKKLPGGNGALKIADGIASALLGTVAAVFVVGVAQQWSYGIGTEDSALYAKVTKLYRSVEEMEKNAGNSLKEKIKIPETVRR